MQSQPSYEPSRTSGGLQDGTKSTTETRSHTRSFFDELPRGLARLWMKIGGRGQTSKTTERVLPVQKTIRPIETFLSLSAPTESSSGALGEPRVPEAVVTRYAQEIAKSTTSAAGIEETSDVRAHDGSGIAIAQQNEVIPIEPERLDNTASGSRLASSTTLRQAPNIAELGVRSTVPRGEEEISIEQESRAIPSRSSTQSSIFLLRQDSIVVGPEDFTYLGQLQDSIERSGTESVGYTLEFEEAIHAPGPRRFARGSDLDKNPDFNGSQDNPVQVSAGESAVGDGVSVSVTTTEQRGEWILNEYIPSNEDFHVFFVTYINPRNKWHRLNIYVVKPSQTDLARSTINAEISDAAAISPDYASEIVREVVRGILRDSVLKDTTRYVHISTDSRGRLDIWCEEHNEEAARIPRLTDALKSLWRVPITRDLELLQHLGAWTYRVRSQHQIYLFHQVPHAGVMENFFTDLCVLNSTVSCRYMSNLTYIVYDRNDSVCGYLTTETEQRVSLYDALRMYSQFRNEISWSTRLGWAVQLATALTTLHLAGFVHGTLSLRTIFLVLPSGDHEHDQTESPSQCPNEVFQMTSSTHGFSQGSETASFPVMTDPLSKHTILVSTPGLGPVSTIPDPYIAPELVPFRDADFPLRPSAGSDVYALGAVLWALGGNDSHLPSNLPRLPHRRGRRKELTREELRFWEVVRTCRAVQEQRLRADVLLQSLQEVGIGADEPIQPT